MRKRLIGIFLLALQIGFVETNVASADLNEAEPCASAHRVIWYLAESFGTENASAYSPNHPCAGPGHALQEAAAIRFHLCSHFVRSGAPNLSPSKNGLLHVTSLSNTEINPDIFLSKTESFWLMTQRQRSSITGGVRS